MALDDMEDDDLAGAFFAAAGGWARAATMATGGASTIPVSTGTALTGILERLAFDGREQLGPTFLTYGLEAIGGNCIGRYLTVTGVGDYRVEAAAPQDDGKIYLLQLREVT